MHIMQPFLFHIITYNSIRKIQIFSGVTLLNLSSETVCVAGQRHPHFVTFWLFITVNVGSIAL